MTFSFLLENGEDLSHLRAQFCLSQFTKATEKIGLIKIPNHNFHPKNNGRPTLPSHDLGIFTPS